MVDANLAMVDDSIFFKTIYPSMYDTFAYIFIVYFGGT